MDSNADSDADAGDIGVGDGVEEHEDIVEEEEESASESENLSSDEDEDEDESESESENDWGESVREKLIRRLKAKDETLSHVMANSCDELRQVCAAVQEENSNISHFSMCGNSIVINQNAACAITTVLAKMPHLSHFSIINCDNVDFEAAAMLAAYLSSKSSIRRICWVGSNLGDRGAQVIAARFSGNTVIQEIILLRNNIGDDGAIAIASLIESNDSITKLSLSGNKIGTEGARRLVHAIIPNQRLEELYMAGNSQACADATENAFKTAIYNNASIEAIISRSNHTIKRLHYIIGRTSGEKNLIDLHRDGPEKAKSTKIIRFLNEQPTSLLSMNLDKTLMPPVLDKVGRDCLLNTMFELVRNMPDLLRNIRTQPNHQCRKRSRCS